MMIKQCRAFFFTIFCIVFIALSGGNSVTAAENNVYDINEQKVTIKILPKAVSSNQDNSNLPNTKGGLGSTINRLLPKTGEEAKNYFSIIGIGLISIVFLVYRKNRRGE